nr:hypothetical protein [uncultured Mediterranean phage uvMED]
MKFLNDIDLQRNELQFAKIHVLGTAPSSPTPQEGQVYYNSTDKKVYVHNGTIFTSIAGDITEIQTTTANQLAITNGQGPIPSLAVTTGAVSDGGTALATGDQIYDHITTRIANSFSDVSYAASTGVITFTQQDGTTDKTVNLPLGSGESPTFAGLTISDSTPFITLTDTDTNADCRINSDSSAGSLTISADFNNEANTTKIGFLCDGKEVGRFRGDNNQIGSLRLFPLRSDNTEQGIFFGTNATEPGNLAGTFVRAISFSTGNKLHLYPSGTTASASVPLAISASGAIEGTSIKDEDNMSSDSATHLATQQSIKAYVDGQTYDDVSNANLLSRLAGLESSGGAADETITIGTDAGDTVSFTGSVTIQKDLIVQGDTVTLNVSTLDVEDATIRVAKNATTLAASDGAGIEFGASTSKPTILWSNSASKLVSNKAFQASSFTGNLTGDVTGNVSGNLTGTVNTATQNSITTMTGLVTVGTLTTGNATAIVDAASSSAAGKVELATNAEANTGTDTARAVTPASLLHTLQARSFSATIGDASNTTFNVDHGLGLDVIVQVYDISSGDTVFCDVVRNNTNSGRAVLTFADAPASNDIKVLVIKVD